MKIEIPPGHELTKSTAKLLEMVNEIAKDDGTVEHSKKIMRLHDEFQETVKDWVVIPEDTDN